MKNSIKYKEYMESHAWSDIREAMLRKAGYKCFKCKSVHNLQVHHRQYEKEFGTENSNDLMVVCDECHNSLHMDLEFFKNNWL